MKCQVIWLKSNKKSPVKGILGTVVKNAPDESRTRKHCQRSRLKDDYVYRFITGAKTIIAQKYLKVNYFGQQKSPVRGFVAINVSKFMFPAMRLDSACIFSILTGLCE